MSIDAWDEIRTAYHVARLGTVSGAADALGVHHATVIRHIDALEGRLSTKLFQRHARGYTATEAGRDLLQVAQATDDQFSQLAGRLRGRGSSVSGELVFTAIQSLSPLLSPVIARFHKTHPGLITRFVSDDRVLRLEYGEAHVAVRAGAPPQELDNVVQPFATLAMTLYASQSYIDEHGMPTEEEVINHRFVGADRINRAPFDRWMRDNVDADNIVFRGTDSEAMKYAILEGVGIGFLSCWNAEKHPELVQVCQPREEWKTQLWLVTHVDLHRTPKVQALLTHLKDEAAGWTCV